MCDRNSTSYASEPTFKATNYGIKGFRLKEFGLAAAGINPDVRVGLYEGIIV